MHSSIFHTEQKQNSQFQLNDLYHLLFPGPPRLFHAHFFFFFCISVQQSVTASHPANEPGSQLSCLPACLPALSSQTDRQWRNGLALEANGSCPPPRAENGLECCLPQTQQATTEKNRSKYRSSSLRFR